MDACIELILPFMVNVPGSMPATTPLLWGGVTFPPRENELRWGEFVAVVPGRVPNHLNRFTGSLGFDSECIALAIIGDGLELMRQEVNGKTVDWHGRSLENLIRIIAEQVERWAFVFEPQCDQIDNICYGTIDSCINILKSNLTYDSTPKGFVFLHM